MKTINFAKIRDNLNEYLLLSITLGALIGGGVYYLYALNQAGIMIALAIIIISFIFLKQFFVNKNLDNSNIQPMHLKKDFFTNKKYYLLIILYIVLLATMFILLNAGKSGAALASPWEAVNKSFFVIYGLSFLTLIAILSEKTNMAAHKGAKILLISLYYLISFSIAAIVYKIGYGYDPFIHQATMELIAEKGIVLPKPPYYLGEYGLIVILHKVSGISIYFLNKMLIPALAAILLPSAVLHFLETRKPINQKANLITVLLLLILTFSPFIASTPQNLSYIFLILTILSGISGFSLVKTSLLAATTAIIHPLAGLPALGWTAWLIFDKYQSRFKPLFKKIILGIIFSFTSLSLPATLFFSGGSNINGIRIKEFFVTTKNIFSGLTSAGNENLFLNFIHFFSQNYRLIIIIFAVISLWHFYKQSKQENIKDIKNPSFKKGLILINSSLIIAYLLCGLIYFNDLINYEQNGYANRILIVMIIFLLPFIVIALQSLIIKIIEEKIRTKIYWIFLGLIFITASLYVSYPRFDKYLNSHGYSTSDDDLIAVKSIDQKTNRRYVSLANQQVSAAALKTFGFDHYYETSSGPIYFYPVPTGGPLYQYYLEMVYQKPGRDTALKAMDLTGVDESYLIINKYWYQSGRIINKAKLEADEWWTINDNIYIFKYKR